MRVSQQTIHPDRDRPPGDAATAQQLLAALEKVWTSHQARILVPLDARQHPDVFLLCLECLLQQIQGKPLLVLSSASAQPELLGRWQAARSINGQLLAQRFPFCFLPTLPPGEQTGVCFSTVRLLQLQQLEETERLSTRFEGIVAYDFPTRLSPVWKRVIEREAVRTLMAFCANPEPEVVQWCDTVIEWERKQKGL